MKRLSDVYEKLYHYTTLDGLLGILKTKSIWATHCRYLNDYSELGLFRDKLVSFILPYVEQKIGQQGRLLNHIQHDAEVVVDELYKATGDGIYILSFCGQHKKSHINDNGLLSQWRAYGAGGGFALVLNTHKLEEILKVEAERFEYSWMMLADLIYSDDDDRFKRELSNDLSTITEVVKVFFDPTKSDDEKIEEGKKARTPFIKCISRYKHCGFSEENEVRVVVIPTIFDQEYLKLAKTKGVTLKPEKEKKFRDKNGRLVPYIELFNSTDLELPIERIIVGPHKEKKARADALRLMLRDTSIEITCSDIPFVG
jgi:hypothetical protein